VVRHRSFIRMHQAGAVNFIPREAGEEASGLFSTRSATTASAARDFWYGTPLGDGWKLAFGATIGADDGIRDPGFTADKGGQLRATISKEWEQRQVQHRHEASR